MRRTVKGAQRREGRAQVRVDQLPHVFRTRQVTQPGDSKTDQPEIRRQIIGDQRRSRLRDQDLAAMATRPQPGAADHGSPDIVAVVAWLRLPGVHRDTDREPRQVCLEASLRSRGGLHGIGDTGEHADHTVALTLLDRT